MYVCIYIWTIYVCLYPYSKQHWNNQRKRIIINNDSLFANTSEKLSYVCKFKLYTILTNHSSLLKFLSTCYTCFTTMLTTMTLVCKVFIILCLHNKVRCRRTRCFVKLSEGRDDAWTDPQMSIIFIYNATWSILIQ